MALATTVTGDGILVDKGTETRILKDFLGFSYTLTHSTETREWVALTKAACEDKIANPDTAPEGYTYSYRMREENRIVGSYALTRIKTGKTLTPPE